ncbi:hypothetical protein [Azospirillum sp. SYSU D00513]|uniref:hypothetical protein n=1 Tax=Azospirillum sp. SYSU D00513 TaxID=2812561 RepID=UPI001A96D947|nr:hypothetical protein [Azospirillum sp. SYSU D00513]
MKYSMLTAIPLLLLAACEGDGFQNGALETQATAQAPSGNGQAGNAASMPCGEAGCETASVTPMDEASAGLREERN